MNIKVFNSYSYINNKALVVVFQMSKYKESISPNSSKYRSTNNSSRDCEYH